MATRAQPNQNRAPSHPIYLNEGLSSKKTALIIVTVVGCIAILWPKVFYPMMFGAATVKPTLKEQRGPGGCCDVVLDREKFLNSTPLEIGPQLYRKKLNLLTGEMSLRQERPAHLHPESIYQAMRERGRAIPPTQTVPIVERKTSPSNPPPRIVEGRPGPIPGMRPPMGAGALHQPQQKGNSMGFIMPLYTIGIIVFFGYTIMKLAFKKPIPNAPYGPAPTDPNFRKEVFGQENGRHVEDLNGTKLVVTAIQGLIDAADEQLNSHENKSTSYINKQPTDNSTPDFVASTTSEQPSSNVTTDEHTENNDAQQADGMEGTNTDEAKDNATMDSTIADATNVQQTNDPIELNRNKREHSQERSVTVLGMEITASCEGGQKWSKRPPTPVFLKHAEHSKPEEDFPEPQSIYLEGALPHESQILVSDAETTTEVYEAEFNGSPDEPAVVISSKMTLSLINLDVNEENDNENSKCDVESPLADDIEIIGHDEH